MNSEELKDRIRRGDIHTIDSEEDSNDKESD